MSENGRVSCEEKNKQYEQAVISLRQIRSVLNLLGCELMEQGELEDKRVSVADALWVTESALNRTIGDLCQVSGLDRWEEER